MSPARRHRRPELPASARVGWAKYYDELGHSQQLQQIQAVLVDRIETLVPVMLELVDDVLHERNMRAFGRAHHVYSLISDYQTGKRR